MALPVKVSRLNEDNLNSVARCGAGGTHTAFGPKLFDQ